MLTRLRDYLAARRRRATVARLFNAEDLRRVHELNRASVAEVPCWITDETRAAAVFQYGIPDEIRHLIDRDIGAGITYTDALTVIAGQLKKKVRYLEIGVSVGKNFWPMTQRLQNAELLGFDIEEMSPVLAERLIAREKKEWATMSGSMKLRDSSLTEYELPGSTNRVRYLSGDVFDEASWRQLAGEKFNLIFSDAFHSAEALRHEYAMLLKHDLLDPDELIMMWDDLGGEMSQVFEEIARDLARTRGHNHSQQFIIPLKGWLGDNWDEHAIGFSVSIPR